jgi:hypothetical protein
MLIQFILLMALSVVVVIWPNIFTYILNELHRLYTYLSKGLGLIFSNSHLGQFIQSTLALLIIPLCMGLICFIVLKLMQKKKSTVIMQIIWMIWMLLVATIALI